MKTKIKSIKGQNVKLMPFGNRVIDQKQVNYLKSMISTHGITRTLVVVYTNLFGEGYHNYIKDGQHLFLACKALGIEDELFIVLDQYKYTMTTKVIVETASINADQKGWKLQDFVTAFSSTNQLLDYNILANKFLTYGLSIQLTAMIYGGLNAVSSSQMIRSGKFKIIDEAKGDEIAKILQDVVAVFGKTNYTLLRQFTFIFYSWFNNINYKHKKFIKHLKTNQEAISTMRGNQIEEMLQNIK